MAVGGDMLSIGLGLGLDQDREWGILLVFSWGKVFGVDGRISMVGSRCAKDSVR